MAALFLRAFFLRDFFAMLDLPSFPASGGVMFGTSPLLCSRRAILPWRFCRTRRGRRRIGAEGPRWAVT